MSRDNKRKSPSKIAVEGDWFSLGRKDKVQVKMGRVGFEPTTNALKGHCYYR